MTQPANPLAGPDVWNLIADDYASDLLPFFEHYSRAALDLAELPPAPRIADVACGPGTLSLLAAAQFPGARIDALDIAEDMLTAFRARVAAEKIRGIEIVTGDGQNLPWESGAYDGAFSMFGLIFFPDRAAGFQELRRILKPGARAVVSSWAPRTGPFALVLESISALLPGYPFGKGKAPLGDPEEMAAAMRDAGFRDVRVERVEHAEHFPTLDAFWARTQRTAAPLRLLREKLGEAEWSAVSAGVRARLGEALGEGPLASPGLANIGVGVR